jgi:hypothetical protein
MDIIEKIDIDNYDWETNQYISIVNGKLMDIRTCGGNVVAPAFKFAHNARDNGTQFCKTCGEFYARTNTSRVMGNHSRSRIHVNALKGKFELKKKPKRIP